MRGRVRVTDGGGAATGRTATERAPTTRGGSAAEEWVAGGAVAAAGCGVVLGLGGLHTGETGIAVTGVLVACAGLLVLLVAGWLDGLLLLVLALALPAPYATDDLRVSAAAGLTALVVFAWLLRRGVDGETVAWEALPRKSVAAVLMAVTLAAAFSLHPVPAARELTSFLLLFGLLAVATDELQTHPRRVRRLVLMAATVVAVAGPLAVLEAVGVLPGRFPLEGTSLNRATLGFGWPNELGMFFAVGLPLTVFAFQAARWQGARIAAGCAVVAAVLGLGATFSRGAWLAVPAGGLALFLVGSPRSALRVWLVMLAGVVVADLLSGGLVRERLLSLPGDWVVEQRAALLVVGLLMFREHPFLGVGPGGFGEELERFGPQITWLWDYVGDAHNAYVQMAAEAGIMGLAAFLAFILATFRILLGRAREAHRDPDAPPEERALRRALLWAFAVACAVSFTAWPFAHGVGQLIVLVAAAGFVTSPGSGSPEEEVR